MPFIRYEIGDIGSINNLNKSRKSNKTGKVDNIILPSGKISPGLALLYQSHSKKEVFQRIYY